MFPQPLYSASRRALVAAVVALLALALSGCTTVDVEQQVPLASPSFRSLTSGVELGQTFVVHHDGLAGVAILLQPETPGDGTLRAELLPARGAEPVATASLPIAAVTEAHLYQLPFAAPLPSRQRDYFLALSVEGAGSVQAAVVPGAAYRDGSLYVGGAPADGQLVHAHVFAPGARLAGFAWRLLSYAGITLAALVVLVLPGLGVLAALHAPGERRTPGERVGLAVGVSTALLAVLMVWTRAADLQLGPWNIWLPALLGAVLLGWRALRLRQTEAGERRPETTNWRAALPGELALLGVVLLIVLVRLAVVGSLEAPMWGDAYQHAMMTQLILDQGGLFSSWAPYEPYETLTVQFGFSAVAAALAWSTGMDGVEATIIAGQLLNATAALALYPLAVRLARGSRLAGLVAVLVAGLLLPLPGMYVNWGRYAQLSGQTVLPAAMVLTWDLLAAQRRSWRQAALLGLVVAGMALCYYRMVFFYAAFVGVLLLCWALPAWRARWREWLAGLGWLALAGTVTAVLFAPWAINVASSQLAATIGEAAAVGTPLEYVRSDYAAWGLLPQLMPVAMIAVAGLAMAWAALRREWMLPGMLLWIALPAGYMATSLVGVPGAVMLQSFAVVIATFIPVAVACGWLAAAVQERVEAWAARREAATLRLAARAALPLLLVALALWGGRQQLRIVDPAHILVTRPDVKAMRWIEAETPPDARFLVHGFGVYGDTSVVGADGGWWIPLLGRRANTMPPQYALANERPAPPDYTQRTVELVLRLRDDPPTTPDGMRVLCAWGITHLYHGQGQGAVGTSARPLFTPAELAASPHFTRQYAEDRVAIFSFDRAACPVADGP